MKAIVFAEIGRWELQERQEPKIENPRDVLLEVEACGICGTDRHILANPPSYAAALGIILGHEFVARVAKVGAQVRNVNPGDRVVVDPTVTCGYCASCRRGLTNVCLNVETMGVVRDGALARFVVAPATLCHPISENVPAFIAALAQPLACVIHGYNLVNLRAGESVVVLGGGPIGLLFVHVVKAAGAGPVIVSEVSEPRRQQALRAGAEHVIDPTRESLTSVVRGLTGGLGADVVVEAVGTLLPQAVETARRGGRIILFGMNSEAQPEISPFTITRHALTIYGSHAAAYTFPAAVSLIESNAPKLGSTVSHCVPLTAFSDAIELVRSGEATKVVLQVTDHAA